MKRLVWVVLHFVGYQDSRHGGVAVILVAVSWKTSFRNGNALFAQKLKNSLTY